MSSTWKKEQRRVNRENKRVLKQRDNQQSYEEKLDALHDILLEAIRINGPMFTCPTRRTDFIQSKR